MLAHHMHGYWMPAVGTGVQRKPYLWRWAEVYAGLVKAADDQVPMAPSWESGEPAIGLDNPAERGVPRTISLSAQILMPGGRTRAHRSLENEARFVIQASPGATFAAEGEIFPMEAGDLLVSPAGTGREHHSGGSMPTISLSGLDVELVRFMGAEIHAGYAVDRRYGAAEKPAGYFAAAQDRMKNPGGEWALRRPPIRYPWTDTFAALTALKESEAGGDQCDGVHLRYTSPLDRGPTFATFSCEIQLFTPGLQMTAHRHNSTATYYVVRGEGRTEVADQRLEWAQGDIFSLPPWTWHRHENTASEDAILYSVDDWPAMAKMGFYRIEGESDPSQLGTGTLQ